MLKLSPTLGRVWMRREGNLETVYFPIYLFGGAEGERLNFQSLNFRNFRGINKIEKVLFLSSFLHHDISSFLTCFAGLYSGEKGSAWRYTRFFFLYSTSKQLVNEDRCIVDHKAISRSRFRIFSRTTSPRYSHFVLLDQ